MAQPPKLFAVIPSDPVQRGLRRAGEIEAARLHAERQAVTTPNRRRAWARLAWLSLRSARLGDVDRSLAKIAELDLARGHRRSAARTLLRRAALSAEPGAVAGLVRQALDLTVSAGDSWGRFLSSQALAVLAVRRARPDDSTEAIGEALTTYLRAGIEVGREPAALAAVSQLAMGEGPGASTAARLLATRAGAHGEHEIAARWLIEALRREPAEGAAGLELQLERLALSHGLWSELAALYQRRGAQGTGQPRTEALEQFAELCEDELHDPTAAAETYRALLLPSPALGRAGAGRGHLRELLRLGSLLGTLDSELEALRRAATKRRAAMADAAQALEQLAQSDLPAGARVQLLEAIADVALTDLADPGRAVAARSRAEALRHRTNARA